MSAPSYALTDDEWEALKKSAEKSTDALGNALCAIMDFSGDQRRNVADQIQRRARYTHSLNELSYAERWLTAFAKNERELSQLSRPEPFFVSRSIFGINLRQFAKQVLKAAKGQSRADILKSIFQDKDLIQFAAEILRDQYHASKKEGLQRDEKFVLSDDELNEARVMQLKFYEALEPEEFIAMASPYSVLYAWNDISESDDQPARFLDHCMDTDEGFLNTLSALREVTSSAQDGNPRIPENYLEPFMDVGKIKSRLDALAKEKSEFSANARELQGLWWTQRY